MNVLKVLHVAALPRPSAGIINQMTWESLSAKEAGLDFTSLLFCPKGRAKETEVVKFLGSPRSVGKNSLFWRVIDWYRFNVLYCKFLRMAEKQYDAILLRYSVANIFQLFFILSSKKPIYLVHHSLEMHELRTGKKLVQKIMLMLEFCLGKVSIRSSAGIIGVTAEIVQYEKIRAAQRSKKAIVYPNGIKFSDEVLDDERNNLPELIFVSSFFYPWHGLDLLLEAAEKFDGEFILHLVGEISLEDSLRAIQDPRIKIHGVLSAAEIGDIAKRCWLGLSSFALYRNNMREACTLKVREYLMLGLPVYAGYKDVFPDDFLYFRNGALDFNEIIEYSYSMRHVSRSMVAETARPYIDKKAILLKLFHSL